MRSVLPALVCWLVPLGAHAQSASGPSSRPTSRPSSQPSSRPSSQPSSRPSSQPSSRPELDARRDPLAAWPSGPVPDVESLVAEALRNHPGLDARRRSASAHRMRVDSAGAWSDPTLSVAMNNVPFDPLALDATPMTGIRIGIQQPIPWPGKLASREAVVEHEARAAEEGHAEASNRLAANVRRVYYQLHLTDVTKHVINENLNIIDGFIGAADAKYRVGRGRQQDVLKARVAKGELYEQAIQLDRQRRALEIRLNRLLARGEQQPIPILIDVAISEFPDNLPAEPLLSAIAETRPALRALEAQSEARTAAAERYETDYYPDVLVGLAYTIRQNAQGSDPVNGADFFSASLGVRLPVFGSSRLDPMVRASREERRALESELDDGVLEIRRVIESSLYEIPKIRDQMRLYRESIIPSMKQALAADRIAYQTDQVDFQNLLDLEMKLLRFEVQFHTLHIERELLIVDLAEAVGVSPAELPEVRP